MFRTVQLAFVRAFRYEEAAYRRGDQAYLNALQGDIAN